ncbi:MAG: hypothetical protein ACYDAG_04270 [Chloroflexota bacterium]
MATPPKRRHGPAGPASWPGLLVLAISAAATAAYVALLATDTVDGLRGNAQWHLPYVVHPANQWWWLPVVPGLALLGLASLSLAAWLSLGLGILLVCCLAYLLFAAQWGGGDNLLGKIFNGSTDFFHRAATIPNMAATLRHYPSYLRGVGPSHTASHPPGNVLFFRGLDDLTRADPAMAHRIIDLGRPFISGIPMLLRSGMAPYLLAAGIAAIPAIVLLGRLAAVPFVLLTTRLDAPAVASGFIFLVLPTTLVHIPILDTVYPLLSAIVVLVGVLAVERQSLFLAGLAGLLLGLALLFTAALAVLVVLLGIYALLRLRWGAVRLAAAFVTGLALSWLGLWLAWGINMPAIYLWLRHYQQLFESGRSYWLWFRWKWYDFVMFAGIPVTALCLTFLAGSLGRWRKRSPEKLDLFFTGWLGMMVVLWLSPLAKAEVGRLWAPMMCFAAIFAARALPRGRWSLPLVLALQIAQVMVINRYLEVIAS